MKRKSTLILIAALVLAVTIPAFAFAAGNGNAMNTGSSTRMAGRGNTEQAVAAQQGTQLMLQDCDDLEDCDCIAEGTGLGADGEALRQYTRNESGVRLYLNSASGTQTVGTGFAGNCPWTE